MKLKYLLLLVLVLYLASAVGTYAYFSQGKTTHNKVAVNSQEQTSPTALSTLLDIKPGEPQDQECPLNGRLYTKTEQQAWEKRRPLAVMIENSPDARPQSGLSRADIVFEAVAEGGVTRFMAMFYCGAQFQDVTIAPVRSARTYFVDWASGFNLPLYVHVGGANISGPADALGQISKYGWNQENDLNQFSLSYPTFVRNGNRLGRPVATEHTMQTSSELLWAVGEDRGWTNMSPERKIGRKVIQAEDWADGYDGWSYLDDTEPSSDVTKIEYGFWDGYGQYAVSWSYDPQSDTYQRSMAGKAHTDLNNDEQIAASNVIVLKTNEKGPIDELKHMLYRTTGTGTALIFNNGTVTQATWSKKDREAELRFLDTKGKEVKLARGLTWISVVDVSNDVDY